MDGWCEGGFGHQRSDGGGCATIREIYEIVEGPVHMQLNEFHEAFLLCLVFFLTALPCCGGYYLEGGRIRYMMRLG